MTAHRLTAAMCVLILGTAFGPAFAQRADDAVRPTAWEAKHGSGYVLITLQRAKP